MWRRYFKLVKIVPGPVVVPGKGKIDFSKDNLPVELCKELFENDFPYLKITDEGKKELYGLEKSTPAETPVDQDKQKVRKKKK